MKRRFRIAFDIAIVLVHVGLGAYLICARPLDGGSWWGNIVTAMMIVGIGATAYEFTRVRQHLADIKDMLSHHE